MGSATSEVVGSSLMRREITRPEKGFTGVATLEGAVNASDEIRDAIRIKDKSLFMLIVKVCICIFCAYLAVATRRLLFLDNSVGRCQCFLAEMNDDLHRRGWSRKSHQKGLD